MAGRLDKEGRNADRRRNLQKWRLKALVRYGGKCNCCGEKETAFLTFDHVNGDGKTERSTGINKVVWYRQLALASRRVDLQILCANCNLAKDRPGGCPHQPSK